MIKKYYYILSVFLPIFVQAKTVYIVPIGGHDVTKFFYDPQGYRDETTKPFCCLREALEAKGYNVKFTWDGKGIDLADFAALISLNDTNPKLLANISSCPREKCFLFVFEPPVVLPQIYQKSHTQNFGKIFVMLDDIVDNVNYFKFYYPQPRNAQNANIPGFTQKKFCVLIAGNKNSGHANSLYKKRRDVISYFAAAHPGELDLYGPGWKGYADWKGTVPQKWEVLKNYKFCFCYENMGNQNGYITEKIFDCLVGGCVPIYLGASNITDYVPKECFIDRRDFSSEEDLYGFLKSMNEESYLGYMDAIKHYFKTPQAHLYSIDNFISIIMNAIEQDG